MDKSQESGNDIILVTGGTGKTGGRVATRLAALGHHVRIASRAAEIPFDWDKPETWAAALDGVSAVYICFSPDLGFPGAAETVEEFSRQAVKADVGRLVLLSGRGEAGAQAGERAVMNAGTEWTIVRCSWFNQNFSESFFVEPVLEAEIAIPAGDAVEPFVDADDIADVAVAALTENGHAGQIYELTGPRLLSFATIAAELTAATGRKISYIPVTAEEYRAVLVENGLPPEFGDLFGDILDGRNATLTDGVERALGRKPLDFADYARSAAATGIWNA